MNSQKVGVYRILMSGPGDWSGLQTLFDTGVIDPGDIVAILGKTEGNGGVNDFTREYASRSVARLLSQYLNCAEDEVEHRVALVMSGGTEGVLSPHATVFTRCQARGMAGSNKRLAIGIARTRDFLPEEIGTSVQIEETSKAVKLAMLDAGINEAADVHFVQIKCPLLTAGRVKQAQDRGCPPVTEDSYASMGYSRGASALGVAVALGELPETINGEAVLSKLDLYSSVASTSAGIELLHNVIIVMGNATPADGPYVIGHATMLDAIDLQGVQSALVSVGIDAATPAAVLANRVVNVFAKAESSPDGQIRGLRHTMLDDSDITATRHARAAVGGLIAGVVGYGSIYVSGGAEHQGPPGGGPVAVIARI